MPARQNIADIRYPDGCRGRCITPELTGARLIPATTKVNFEVRQGGRPIAENGLPSRKDALLLPVLQRPYEAAMPAREGA